MNPDDPHPDDAPLRPRTPGEHPWRHEQDDHDDPPPRRRRDGNDDDDTPPPSTGLATASLICGVLSCGLSCAAGIPAIILGIMSLSRSSAGKGMAMTGLILGCLSTVALPVMIGLLLPAVQRVRDAAAPTQEMNNAKQVVLATDSYASSSKDSMSLPPADGPVSWRVLILPHLEQQAIFAQFDVKQLWDNPKNRPLADLPPKVFISPMDPPGTKQTRMRVFTGPKTLYTGDPDDAKMTPPDGASNTIFLAYADELVPWSQPKELTYSPTGPLPKFSQQHHGGFIISMLDGSTRFVPKTVSEETLRALITASGNDKPDNDW